MQGLGASCRSEQDQPRCPGTEHLQLPCSLRPTRSSTGLCLQTRFGALRAPQTPTTTTPGLIQRLRPGFGRALFYLRAQGCWRSREKASL